MKMGEHLIPLGEIMMISMNTSGKVYFEIVYDVDFLIVNKIK